MHLYENQTSCAAAEDHPDLLVGADEYVVLLMEDYIKILDNLMHKHEKQRQQSQCGSSVGPADHDAAALHILQAFRSLVVPQHHDAHITKARLLQMLKGSTAAAVVAAQDVGDVLRHLLAAELVCRDASNPDSFIFTVPGASAFVKSVISGRKELLQLLSRRK
jgi:hypothetical protein